MELQDAPLGKVGAAVKLRIEQRVGESPDLMLMRGFVSMLDHMPKHHAIAAANWMRDYANDRAMWGARIMASIAKPSTMNNDVNSTKENP